LVPHTQQIQKIVIINLHILYRDVNSFITNIYLSGTLADEFPTDGQKSWEIKDLSVGWVQNWDFHAQKPFRALWVSESRRPFAIGVLLWIVSVQNLHTSSGRWKPWGILRKTDLPVRQDFRGLIPASPLAA
jgi:hypothetical protein